MFKSLSIGALALLATGLMTNPASAESFAKDETFDHAQKVGDKELAGMRGGFISINGVLMDFSFLSRVQVGLDIQQDVSVDTASLTQAAATATQIQDLLQPQIIQNMDSNTLISIQQALTLTIVNPEQLGQQAQMQQSLFQQSLGGQ